MLNCSRSALFCLFFVVVIKCSAGFWDFWPFNTNTETTPNVKIIPETEGNFIYLDESRAKPYIDSMNKFLDAYTKPTYGENLYNCDFNNPPLAGRVCVFNTRDLGPCTPANDYNFHKSSPCFLFTLSQVLNWTPAVLNVSDIQQTTANSFSSVPAVLKMLINHSENEDHKPKYIWLTCDGDTAADKEFIGFVNYFPHRGFPTYYFPFENLRGYQSPIVAVHFERPTRGVVINIICKAWAKNIPLDEDNGLDTSNFNYLLSDL